MNQTPIDKIMQDLVDDIVDRQEELPDDSWEYDCISNMHGRTVFTEKQRKQIRRIADHLKLIY